MKQFTTAAELRAYITHAAARQIANPAQWTTATLGKRVRITYKASE